MGFIITKHNQVEGAGRPLYPSYEGNDTHSPAPRRAAKGTVVVPMAAGAPQTWGVKILTAIPSPFCLIRKIMCILIAITSLAQFNCSTKVVGTGTETSGGERLGKVRGKAVTRSGAPAADASVEVVPVRHSPLLDGSLSDSLILTAASDGTFESGLIEPGIYNIYIRHIADGTVCLARGMCVDSGKTTDAGTLGLDRPGSVRIALKSSTGLADARLFVEGTTIAAAVDAALLSQGIIAIDSLPSGVLPPIGVVSPTVKARLASDVVVTAGATTQVQAGRTMRVSTAGSDDNDGVIAPLRTVARGCELVSAGDTLIIEPGEYHDNWPLERVIGGGMPDAPVLIRAAASLGAILRGDRNADSGFAIWEGLVISRATNVIIEGLVFADFLHGIRIEQSSDVSISGCDFIGNGYIGLKAVSSNKIDITACRFIDSAAAAAGNVQEFGIYLDSAADCRIGDCVFFGYHPSAPMCIESRCVAVDIRRCAFEGFSGYALRSGLSRAAASSSRSLIVDSCLFRPAAGMPLTRGVFVQNINDVTIRNSYFEGNGSSAVSGDYALIELKEEPRGTISVERCVFDNIPSMPLFLIQSANADSVRIIHNTMSSCLLSASKIGTPAVIANNLLWNCSVDVTGIANLPANPLFTGPAESPALHSSAITADSISAYYDSCMSRFRLLNSSPAIDAGADIGDGFLGTAPDLGAFEAR